MSCQESECYHKTNSVGEAMEYMNISADNEAHLLTVKVYLARSGQWSGQAYSPEGEAVAGGGGYASEEEAQEGGDFTVGSMFWSRDY